MIYIPIIFVCAQACMFLQGETEFSLSKCEQSLIAASKALEQRPDVRAFDGICIEIKVA